MFCKVNALQIHPEMIFDESIQFVEHMPPNLESPLYATSMSMCHPDRRPFFLQCVAMVAKGISDTMSTQLGTVNIYQYDFCDFFNLTFFLKNITCV